MSTTTSRLRPVATWRTVDWHKVRLYTAALLIAGVIAGTLYSGWKYYMLPLSERITSPAHAVFRPAGETGLMLGKLGLVFFVGLGLYPLRKKWRWLGRIGKTKHWLDFHVLLGVTAPLIITLHCAFKFRGLAGIAYWLMMTVMASGYIGRYLYAQIPRSIGATALSADEMKGVCDSLSAKLASQRFFSDSELQTLLTSPHRADLAIVPLWRVMGTMLWLDISRPFRVARLRRRNMSWGETLKSLGGHMGSAHGDLEEAIRAVRQLSWLQAKIAFLSRTERIFHLWHVVHRPFSYSFAVLVIIHTSIVVLLGYY